LEPKKNWTLNVEVDEHGEPVLTLPDDMIEQVGWKIGDTIRWSKRDNDSWVLERVS
jgi:antitoxin component of MazEF toxin-antitoxin module